MAYLVFVLVALALLIGFVALTQYEARHGVRVYAEGRARLDARVERTRFVLTHINLAAFAEEESRRALQAIGHAMAHLSLRLVRSVERVLTRLVRHLRTHSTRTPEVAPRESSRPFVQTLSAFKDTLKEHTAEPSQSPKDILPK